MESAALWYENLSATLAGLGYEKNDYEACVYNRTEGGVQCTVAFHVDDLIITSENMSMIDDLCKGLKSEYGEITRRDGSPLNYLGMSFNLSVPGEVSMSMKGYTNDVILCGDIPGKARSPATDGLFNIRDGAELVVESTCKTKYKMSPSSVRSEGGETAAGYCLNSVSYRVDEAVKYNVLNSD